MMPLLPAGMRAAGVAALVAACGGGSDGLGPTGSPTSLRLSRDTATIGIDGSVALFAREVDGRAIAPQVLEWSSSGEGVASVSPAGLVTGIAGGQVEIRVRVADLGDTARITVLPFISLGAAEPRTIDADGRVGGSIGGQPFVWSGASGVRRLPMLPGTSGGLVLGLTTQGTAVGTSGGGDYETGHPVVWTLLADGTATVEELPWDGGPTGFAHGVTTTGDRIVGQVFTRPESNRYSPYAALWTRAADGSWSIELLPVPPDGYAAAFKLNDSGHVLGLVEVDGPQGFTTSAVVWSRLPNLAWTLETVASGPLGTVSVGGINAGGAVVGAQNDRAMLWTRNGNSWASRDLGDLGGGEFSFASDINDAGTVVGASFDPLERQRAFIWTAAEGMRDLGSLSVSASAAVINAGGIVAGLSYHPASSSGQIGTVWPAP